MAQTEQPYDVFISYNQADREWVDEWLLPRLRAAGLRVITDFDFIAGAPRLAEVERAVDSSRRTLAVITPDWLGSEWNNFETLLVQTLDPAGRRRKLIPVLLKPTELPTLLDALVEVDLTAEKHWAGQLRRLVRDVEDVVPVAPPWQAGQRMRDWAQWGRWVRRYRRELRWGVVVALALWLVVSLLLELSPFEQRQGWQAISPRMKGAWRASRVGDVLLVSTRTNFPGGKSLEDTGLWRSPDEGATWQQILIPSLEFKRLDGQRDLAAITWFAHAPDFPQRLYATTTDVGLLRSDDAGASWQRVGEDGLPASLGYVASAPADPDLVFVAAGADQVGIYRSLDGGENWQRLDGAATCSGGADGQALPEGFHAGALLVTVNTVYVGSDGTLQRPGPAAGLYASHDGGDCWQRVDDAEGRYQYQALADMPDAAGQIVALTSDFSAEARDTELTLWQVRAGQGRTRPLWQSGNTAVRVHIDARMPVTWYIATDVGRVFRGSPDASYKEELPRVTRCMLPPTCWTDLAPDLEPGPPLLLANDRLYRYALVPWYRYLWP